MKWYSVAILVSLFITVSCSQKKNKPAGASRYEGTDSRITIEYIGGIEFAKSFSFIQSTTFSEKEIEKMIEEAEKENPIDRDPADSVLKKLFENLGFVKGDELVLQKFIYSNHPDTSIISMAGPEIKIRFKKDTISGRDNKIIAYSRTDSAEVRTTIYMQLEYALLDVISGGNKEVVILNEHYLANTYLYSFDIYEIKFS